MGQAILSFLEKEEKYIFDKFAKQCSGSVYLQSGNNVVLATVAIDTQEVVEEDFLPLTRRAAHPVSCSSIPHPQGISPCYPDPISTNGR